jgi:hypothetical protein
MSLFVIALHVRKCAVCKLGINNRFKLYWEFFSNLLCMYMYLGSPTLRYRRTLPEAWRIMGVQLEGHFQMVWPHGQISGKWLACMYFVPEEQVRLFCGFCLHRTYKYSILGVFPEISVFWYHTAICDKFFSDYGQGSFSCNFNLFSEHT